MQQTTFRRCRPLTEELGMARSESRPSGSSDERHRYSLLNASLDGVNSYLHAFRRCSLALSPQGMWQVILSQLVSWANVCPRSASLAEFILLCGLSRFVGFLCRAITFTLLLSSRCRDLLWVLISELFKPPARPAPESRLAGYRRP